MWYVYFLDLISSLLGLPSPRPPTRGTYTTKIYCLTVLEPGNPRWWCEQGWFLLRFWGWTCSRPSLIASGALLALTCRYITLIFAFISAWRSLCVHTSISKFLLFVKTSVILDQGPVKSPHLIDCLQKPYFQMQSHSQVLESKNVTSFGGYNSSPNNDTGTRFAICVPLPAAGSFPRGVSSPGLQLPPIMQISAQKSPPQRGLL